MKEVVFLIVNRYKVDRMVKNLPRLKGGEYPIKLEVEIDDNAFRPPTITKEIHVTDWLEGMSIGDVNLAEPFITEAEAETIRQQRRDEQVRQLRELGYEVKAPEINEEVE